MSGDASTTAGPAATPSLSARLWGQGLVVHLAAYLGLLAVLLAVGVMDGSFTSDEGAYYLQIELLDEGRWDLGYPLADLDPEGTYFPIINSDMADGRWYPYVKHPLYVHLLDASIGWLGPGVGGHVWSVLGALGAAAAAWLLAGAFEPRLARLAFWLAALGPLLANAQMVWAHAASAAVGGLAAWLVVRAVADDRLGLGRAAGLAALLALGVLLRSEGLLWAGSLLVVLAALAWSRRRWSWLAGLVAAGAATLVAFVVQRAWRTDIVGGGVPTVPDSGADSTGGWFGTRVRGGVDLLTKGAEIDPAAAGVIALVLVFVLLAALSWRARRPPAEAAALVTVAMLLYAARVLFFEADPVGGLFAAWPILLVALVVARRESFSPPALAVAAALGVFTVLVMATQWGEAGGVQWGARYLSPAASVMAALAAVSLRVGGDPSAAPAPTDRRSTPRAFPTGLLAALVLVPALAAAIVPEQLRAQHDEVVDDATRAGVDVVISGQGSVPRFAWRTHDEIEWYFLSDDGTLGDLLDRLGEAGVTEVSTVSIDLDDEDLGDWQVAEEDGDVAVLVRP